MHDYGHWELGIPSVLAELCLTLTEQFMEPLIQFITNADVLIKQSEAFGFILQISLLIS